MLQGNMVICHPDLIKEIRKIVNNEIASDQDFIHRPHAIEIRSDPLLPKERWTGKWVAVKKNERFVTYYEVDENGVLLEEPSSWMIFFGYVKKQMVYNLYLVNTKNYRMGELQVKFIYKEKTPFAYKVQ